ncbi:MAG: hypothetical protein AAF368_06745 [Planctomycetota bacterium]
MSVRKAFSLVLMMGSLALWRTADLALHAAEIAPQRATWLALALGAIVALSALSIYRGGTTPRNLAGMFTTLAIGSLFTVAVVLVDLLFRRSGAESGGVLAFRSLIHGLGAFALVSTAGWGEARTESQHLKESTERV